MKIKEYNVQGKKFRMQIFNKVDTHEQAYLIGYLLGDGGFNDSTHKRRARLFVSSADEYIIKGFQEQFCPDTPISSRIPVNNTRKEIKSFIYSYRLQFPSKFHDTFKKFGVLSVKTERTYHNIKKDFMGSMLLGLFDADGSLSWGRRKDRNRLWCNYLITHPNLKMLEKLQEFLADELNVTTQIRPKGKENCYILRTSNRDNVVKIIDFMYANKPKVYNLTKQRKSSEFITEYKKYSR